MARPSYIYQGGSVMMHSPLHLGQSEMYGFFVKGDLLKLQQTLDASLNTVAHERMHFKALSPYVMMTFTRVNHASSTVPVDQDKGWITEIDIVTWVMTGAMDKDGKLSHIYWYPAHIFVDDAMALINGRELFGYPKYLCEYEIPEAGTPPLRCSVSAKGFQPFGPETRIAMHPLMEVVAIGDPVRDTPITGILDLIEQAIKLFISIPDFFNLDAAGIEDIVSMLRNPRIDQIHSGRVLGYEYECTLHAFDSFPLNDTLGLQLGAAGHPAVQRQLRFHR